MTRPAPLTRPPRPAFQFGVPCVEHGSKSNKKCISCFAADVVDLTLDATGKLEKSDLNKRLGELLERYGELKRSKDEDEYCRSVIFGLNTQLVARKPFIALK